MAFQTIHTDYGLTRLAEAEATAAVLSRAEAFIQWQEFTGIRQRGEWMIQGAETVEEAWAVTWESLTVR